MCIVFSVTVDQATENVDDSGTQDDGEEGDESFEDEGVWDLTQVLNPGVRRSHPGA